MKCSNCQHEQDTGKFCGKCGSALETSDQSTPRPTPTTENSDPVQQPVQPVQPAEPNVHIENVKDKSKVYFAYFMRYLKNPALVYNRGESEVTNSIISILLLVLLMTVSLYMSVNGMYGGYGYSSDSEFISFFISLSILLIVAIGITILAIFLTNTFFGPKLSFSAIVSLYGAHLSPVLVVAVISLLLTLIKSYTSGSLSLLVIFIFILFILPPYLISSLLTKRANGIDPLYGYILYLVIFLIFYMIFATIVADSSFNNFFYDLDFPF